MRERGCHKPRRLRGPAAAATRRGWACGRPGPAAGRGGSGALGGAGGGPPVAGWAELAVPGPAGVRSGGGNTPIRTPAPRVEPHPVPAPPAASPALPAAAALEAPTGAGGWRRERALEMPSLPSRRGRGRGARRPRTPPSRGGYSRPPSPGAACSLPSDHVDIFTRPGVLVMLCCSVTVSDTFFL